MNTVILVAGSGNTTGMNVITALRDFYPVVGCDFNTSNPANLLCKNHVVPKAASKDYPSAIIELVKKEGITHIIASNDHDLRAMANMNDMLVALGVKFNGFTQNILKFLDKDDTYQLFVENNVLTPKTYDTDPQIPFVLRKCKMGDECKFVHIIKSEEDFNDVPQWNKDNGIYSEYIEGEEYTVDVLCDEKANAVSVTPRLRVEVRDGMVWHGKVVYDAKLIATVQDVCKRVNIVGMACLQCIKQGEKYYFIEINPRPGSGIDLSIAAGNNLPLMWVKQSIGEAITPTEPDWNLELLRYYKGYYFKS